MKIGVFGGTFDPPHLGHFEIARAALVQLELDEVIFVPTGRNPFKQASKQSSGRRRTAMLHLLLDDEEHMSVSNIELTRSGPSYTVDTMQEFQQTQPATYWFIMGSDALDGIYEWKQPEKLLKLCRLGVVLRPPHDRSAALRNVPDGMHPFIDFLELPPVPISSTAIRDHVLRRLDPSAYLNPRVWQYIQENKLYEEA